MANSSAVSADFEVQLEPGDGLKIALASGSALCSLTKSLYADAIVQDTAPISALQGTTPVAVSASFYFWAQRSGPASLQQAVTTCTSGESVMVGVEAGSVTLGIAASVIAGNYLGQAMEQGAASEAILVNLNLE